MGYLYLYLRLGHVSDLGIGLQDLHVDVRVKDRSQRMRRRATRIADSEKVSWPTTVVNLPTEYCRLSQFRTRRFDFVVGDLTSHI